MDISNYNYLINSEAKLRKYLLKKCLKSKQRFCPGCGNRKLYKLADERRRCSKCKFTFHDFSCRWINQGRLTAVQWLWIIKLFELEVSVGKMASQIKLAYNTVYNAVKTIRLAIISHAEDAKKLLAGEIEVDESYFRGLRKGNSGRGAAGKVPVLGILERKGE